MVTLAGEGCALATGFAAFAALALATCDGEELLQENESAGMSPAEICALVNRRWQGGKGAGRARKGAGKGKGPLARCSRSPLWKLWTRGALKR